MLIYWTTHAARNWKVRTAILFFKKSIYRHRIKFMDFSKLIFVKQHFHSNSHDFNRNVRFTIIERIEKTTTKKQNNKKNELEILQRW